MEAEHGLIQGKCEKQKHLSIIEPLGQKGAELVTDLEELREVYSRSSLQVPPKISHFKSQTKFINFEMTD